MESQAAIICIQMERERDNSKALRNVAGCRAVLHNKEAKVFCIRYDKDGTVSSLR